jgi:hypothetical protein
MAGLHFSNFPTIRLIEGLFPVPKTALMQPSSSCLKRNTQLHCSRHIRDMPLRNIAIADHERNGALISGEAQSGTGRALPRLKCVRRWGSVRRGLGLPHRPFQVSRLDW